MLLAALLIGALLRVVLVLAFDVTQTSDLAWYFDRARELLQTGRYAEKGVSTAYWPVGYPAFLAGIFATFGTSVLAGQMANVVLSLGCIAAVYRFCAQRFEDPRVGGLAALLLAVYPNHIAYSAGLYSEPLFTFLLLVVVVLVRPGSGLLRLIAAGILIGVATLVKAQMQLLGPLLAFLLLLAAWDRSDFLGAIRGAVIVTIAMAATVAPWTLRNAQVMGKPVIVSTNGGMSLLSGNNPSVRVGMVESYSEDDLLVKAAGFSVVDQVAADDRAKKIAWQWIRENPGQFVTLMPWKAWRQWAYDGEAEWIFQAGYAGYSESRAAFRAVRLANQAFYGLTLLAGLWGLFKLSRISEPQTWLVPFLLAFFTALSMVFSGQSRYHWPLMPFVIAFAAWTILHISASRVRKNP